MTRQPDDIGKILFIFAKEFGWGWEYVSSLPYKIFKMYVRELTEYAREQEAASKGKKYKPEQKPLTEEQKKERQQMIAEWRGQ